MSFCWAGIVPESAGRDYYESCKRKKAGHLVEQKLKDASALQEAIRSRAEEVYRRNGSLAGHDLENWRQAEAEIMRETASRVSRSAVVVNVEGVVYTGEYNVAATAGYSPGEWKPGERVPVRLEGDRLFLRRPNGRELETCIVKRIG